MSARAELAYLEAKLVLYVRHLRHWPGPVEISAASLARLRDLRGDAPGSQQRLRVPTATGERCVPLVEVRP